MICNLCIPELLDIYTVSFVYLFNEHVNLVTVYHAQISKKCLIFDVGLY